MKVLRGHKTPLTRQVQESVEINNSKASIIMNSKNEWNGSKLPRIIIEVGEDVNEEDGDVYQRSTEKRQEKIEKEKWKLDNLKKRKRGEEDGCPMQKKRRENAEEVTRNPPECDPAQIEEEQERNPECGPTQSDVMHEGPLARWLIRVKPNVKDLKLEPEFDKKECSKKCEPKCCLTKLGLECDERIDREGSEKNGLGCGTMKENELECGRAQLKLECNQNKKNGPECVKKIVTGCRKKIERGQTQLELKQCDKKVKNNPECGPAQLEFDRKECNEKGRPKFGNTECDQAQKNRTECSLTKLGLEYDKKIVTECSKENGPECGRGQTKSMSGNDIQPDPAELELEFDSLMKTKFSITSVTISECGQAQQVSEKLENECNPTQLCDKVSLKKRNRNGTMRYKLKGVVGSTGLDGAECGKIMVSECGPNQMSRTRETEGIKRRWPRRSKRRCCKVVLEPGWELSRDHLGKLPAPTRLDSERVHTIQPNMTKTKNKN